MSVQAATNSGSAAPSGLSASSSSVSPSALDPQLAHEVIAAALAHGGDFAEVFHEYRKARSVVIDEGRVKTAWSRIESGVAVRVVVGTSTGHAYCESLERDELVATAKLAAQIARESDGRPTQIQSLHPVVVPTHYRLEREFGGLDVEHCIQMLRAGSERAYARDARVAWVTASMANSERWIEVFASDGTMARDHQPMITSSVQVLVEHEGRRERGYVGKSRRSGLEFLEHHAPESLSDEAVQSALFNLTADPCPAGTMPVVMGPGEAGVLIHEAVGHGLEADFNRKGVSAYSGRVGSAVASSLCTIVDDGTVSGDRGAINIDDEGVAGQRSVLIENGQLLGYMQDKLSAGSMGVECTGNGRRQSYRHATIPRMRVTTLEAGDSDPEEIIGSVERGLYAKCFGGGSVDITKGDYNFEVTEAYLIENGKLTRPVRGATLVGNGPETLQRVSMVGRDLKLQVSSATCGKDGQSAPVGYGTPTFKVDGMVVGGTA